MARSYLPSKVSEIVALWRKDLNKVSFYVLYLSTLESFLLVKLISVESWIQVLVKLQKRVIN